MTRGILLCAHDNEVLWYGRMAYCCSLMILEHMGKQDISLITDEDTWRRLIASYPDTIMKPIIIDKPETNDTKKHIINGETVSGSYFNTSRPLIYDITPYDETLAIDVDMLILDDRLNLVWGSEYDFMMNKELGQMVLPLTNNTYHLKLDNLSIPVYWATVFYFRKTPGVAKFFQLVKYVKENYEYLSLVYGYGAHVYRNDFAFSIAAHILGIVEPLPVPYLTFAWDRDYILQFDKGSVLFRVDGKKLPISRISSNVHCMNKGSYDKFADRIIELYA